MAREPNDYALRGIHADRIVKRQIDELIGLAKGALLDGKVEQHEADGILAWLHGNMECLDTWPASVLYDRLRAMLADGVLDPDEAGELLGLLMQIAAPAGVGAAPAPSTLPLTAPAPEILIRVAASASPACLSSVRGRTATRLCSRAVASRPRASPRSSTIW